MAEFPERFTRDYGCTEAEWQRWMPEATAPGVLSQPEPGFAQVQLTSGRLTLRWHAMPTRRIALITLPRLEVEFAFDGLTAVQRQAFMRRFDLHTQRGGG